MAAELTHGDSGWLTEIKSQMQTHYTPTPLLTTMPSNPLLPTLLKRGLRT